MLGTDNQEKKTFSHTLYIPMQGKTRFMFSYLAFNMPTVLPNITMLCCRAILKVEILSSYQHVKNNRTIFTTQYNKLNAPCDFYLIPQIPFQEGLISPSRFINRISNSNCPVLPTNTITLDHLFCAAQRCTDRPPLPWIKVHLHNACVDFIKSHIKLLTWRSSETAGVM